MRHHEIDTRRCFAYGTEVKDKSRGVGRLLLIDIDRTLLATGTIKAIETRAILNTSFHAVGRGGKVGLLTWSNLYWNYTEELLGCKWNQQKTSDVQEMTFFADASSFEVCEFHSLACYLIVGGGNQHVTPQNAAAQWVFPSLNINSATTAIANMLKELATKVEALHPDVTATDIRVGSVNNIINAEVWCWDPAHPHRPLTAIRSDGFHKHFVQHHTTHPQHWVP